MDMILLGYKIAKADGISPSAFSMFNYVSLNDQFLSKSTQTLE